MSEVPMDSMAEPYRSQFIALLRQGAGTRDIHDGQVGSFAERVPADDRLVGRELGRVGVHARGLCTLLARYVGAAENVLDVGCGTGGTTVAMGLSASLSARTLIGIDPSEDALAAAEIRTRAYGVSDRVSYRHVSARESLPFESGRFDLTTCVSVLEFLGDTESRQRLVGELCRVTAPNGYVVLFTPSPFRLRQYHTGRFLGDLWPIEGLPWSSPPWQLRGMFQDCDVRFLRGEQLVHGLQRRGVPGAKMLGLFPIVPLFLPWQKIIARKLR